MNYPATFYSHSDSQLPTSRNLNAANRLDWVQSGSYEVDTVNTGISIYFVLSGELKVRTDHRFYTVRNQQFLILNEGQKVRISYQRAQRPLQMLAIRLSPKWLSAVHKDLIQSCKSKVSDSLPSNLERIEVYEHVYQASASNLGEFLSTLGDSFLNGLSDTDYCVQSITDEIGERLVLNQCQVYQQLQRLTSAKLSTKKELYRRLCIAKAYIHANLDSSLDLDTLAQVACLSKYHFIRLFKEVYGQTPRQYLITRRLERASKLLLNSSKSFHEICQEVGLKDSSSFGRLFKRSFGATPHLYRQMYAS